MQKIINYKIVESNYTKKLSEGVIALIQQGYVPQGGVSYIKTQSMLHKELIAQAMVLYEVSESTDQMLS